MKIITLRIAEDEKARLELLAERGNVTLSRALREGAALYLGDLHGRLHAARGGRTTFHGVRRNSRGTVITPRSDPSESELRAVDRANDVLSSGLARIRDEWLSESDDGVVLAALRTWLGLVGRLYCGNETFVGWSWFLKDYCPGYEDEPSRSQLEVVSRAALTREGLAFDVESVLGALESGLAAMVRDAKGQERVRRAFVPAWRVLEREVA